LDIGRRLQELREAQGVSRYRLNKIAGLSTSTLHDIETGKKSPTITTLEAICKGLGITLQEFFNWEETPTSEGMLFSTYLGNKIMALPQEKRKLIENLLEQLDDGEEALASEALIEPKETDKQIQKKKNNVSQPINIAQRLRLGRTDKRVSVSQLSKATQIPEVRLTQFEGGEEIPSMKELNIILEALDISVFDFFSHEKPDAISLEIESPSLELREKLKKIINEGGELSFTLKCEIVDVLKDGESVLPVEMRGQRVEDETTTRTADNDGVEVSEYSLSPQYDVNYAPDPTQSYVMEGEAAIDEPKPKRIKNKPRIGNNIGTLAAHRSDDPMTDMSYEAWENVQELLEFHKHEVEIEQNKPKK